VTDLINAAVYTNVKCVHDIHIFLTRTLLIGRIANEVSIVPIGEQMSGKCHGYSVMNSIL